MSTICIGWSITVPTVGGAFLGLWLDRVAPQDFSWTIALLLGGVVLAFSAIANQVTTKVPSVKASVSGYVSDRYAEQLRDGHGRVRIGVRVKVSDYGQFGLLLGRLEALPGVESARRG